MKLKEFLVLFLFLLLPATSTTMTTATATTMMATTATPFIVFEKHPPPNISQEIGIFVEHTCLLEITKKILAD